jgi:hypothetical protein
MTTQNSDGLSAPSTNFFANDTKLLRFVGLRFLAAPPTCGDVVHYIKFRLVFRYRLGVSIKLSLHRVDDATAMLPISNSSTSTRRCYCSQLFDKLLQVIYGGYEKVTRARMYHQVDVILWH